MPSINDLDAQIQAGSRPQSSGKESIAHFCCLSERCRYVSQIAEPSLKIRFNHILLRKYESALKRIRTAQSGNPSSWAETAIRSPERVNTMEYFIFGDARKSNGLARAAVESQTMLYQNAR